MKFIGLACFLTCCIQQYLHAAPANQKLTAEQINYMKSLGYYTEPDSSVGTIGHEKNIRDSLMEMQRFADIPVSGIMDAATKKLINTPRCGMKDVTRNINNVKRKRRYTLQGSTWKKEKLTWMLTNDNNDGLSRAQVEDVMTQAFDKWQKVTNLNFKKLEVSTTEVADIVVKFVRGAHEDPYSFDGEGGTLAHAFYPHNNEGLSGDVHFDDDEQYTINSPQGRSLLWVAVHEIGHSIGLEHSNLKEAVMYPWYRGNGGKDFPLNEDDIIGIQNIYGSRAVHPEKRVTGPTPPTTTTTTTTVAVKPGVKVTLPPAPGCPSDFKAAFLDSRTEKTFIINDDKAYIISKNLGIEKGPVSVNVLFPGVDSADAIYQKKDGNIVVFSGKKFYEFNDVYGNEVTSGYIQSRYSVGENVDRIDAAFIWNGNGRTYLFAGKDYYRFDEARQSLDYGYPKPIFGNWEGLPASVDGVVIWRNKITYFFKDKQYYRFNDKTITVEKGYPKNINPVWTKCKVEQLKDGSTNKSSAITTFGSVFLSFAMLLIVKLL